MTKYMKNSKIIDFHTHVFPDKIAERAIASLEERGNIKSFIEGTKDALTSSLKSSGIDAAVILPIATKPTQNDSINKFAKLINDSDDNLFSFGSVHPDSEDYEQVIDTIKEYNLPGIKLHPDYQGFFVDDPKYQPLFEYIAKKGLPVTVHAGFDVAYPAEQHCTPERMSNLLERVPGLTLIAAHLGGYRYWDDVEKYLVGRNVYIDTSLAYGECPDEQIKRIIENHHHDKVMFATDSPWRSHKRDLAGIMSLGLTGDLLHAVLCTNACKLLNISENDI